MRDEESRGELERKEERQRQRDAEIEKEREGEKEGKNRLLTSLLLVIKTRLSLNTFTHNVLGCALSREEE